MACAAGEESRLIEAIYGVASGETSWMQVMATIRTRFNSHSGNMFLMAGRAAQPEILDRFGMPPKAIADYAAHFYRDDPRLNAAQTMMAVDPEATERVWLGSALFPDAILAESRFYREFGRLLGTRHGLLMAPQLGRAGRLYLSVLRSEEVANFTERDRRGLERLLPHVRRSLQLGFLLAEAQGRLTRTQATLDALKFPIVVVDATMKATDINRAAEALVSSERELEIVRLGPASHSDVRLTFRHKRTSDLVSSFVQEVAAGIGSGGSVRVPRGAKRRPLAVLVMPLPLWLSRAASAVQGTVKGSAMLLFRDLEQPAAPEVSHVACALGLTRAEAEVAIELCAGSTAEVVATRRGTSVTTVRAQVRAVLEKTAFRSLRELAQALAQLIVKT